MARDEKLRRDNISAKDFGKDSWVHKGSKNKLTGEKEVMYICPECNHHAFHVSPLAGRFHCWHCGIYGLTIEAQAERRKQWELEHGSSEGYSESSQAPPLGFAAFIAPAEKEHRKTSENITSTKKMFSRCSLMLSEATINNFTLNTSHSTLSTQLDDYMPLDEDVLETIQDISLEEKVTGVQKSVRDWLEAQKIPPLWANRMRWGVAVHSVKLKGEESSKMRHCVVFRNYVEDYCCNAKFRAVGKITKTKTKTKTNADGTKATESVQKITYEKGFDQQSSYSPCAPYNIDCLWPEEAYSGQSVKCEVLSVKLEESENMSNTEAQRREDYSTSSQAPQHQKTSENIASTKKMFSRCSQMLSEATINNSTLNTSHSTLLITEGEKDCLTLRMLGFTTVISAANGAQTDFEKSFEAFKEWLTPIHTVIIVGDQDDAGRQMMQHATEYFDDRIVKVCRWDKRIYGKDITEVYQRYGQDKALELVNTAETVIRDDIEDFETEESAEKTIQSAMGDYDHGYATGLGPVTDSHFKLCDMGGLVIVTGTPGTGKTDFTNFLLMSLISQRQSHVCFCSFETPDKCRHAGDLTQIWAGGTDLSSLTPEEVKPFADCVMRHITHIRMRKEKPTPRAVLRKAEIVMNRHPDMEYLIIDPYLYLSMSVGRNITETDSIKAMLTEVQEWAHEHHVWVFIVAHPRKLQKDDGSKELEEVDMYTIAGSANWANVADFVFSVKRTQMRDGRGQVTSDYTRMSVLKVRDQKICAPGDVFYNRQSSGRYDERETEQDAQKNTGNQNLLPYPIF